MNKDERVADTTVNNSSKVVKRYKVTINGESYFLVSDEPEEHVRAIARFVDSQMSSLKQQGHSDDPTRQAVLVALQCASKMASSASLIEQCEITLDKLVNNVTETLNLFDNITLEAAQE